MSSSRAMQRLCGLMRKAVQDYEMIAPGDKVMVGVSGGKDSVALTIGLAELRKYIGFDFTVQAVTLDPQFGGRPMDYTVLQELFARYDIPYEIRRTEIGPVVFDYRKEKNPCALCAKLRRGALHTAAQELGCNKVALGHHLDDAIETFYMNLWREGRIGCFSPVTLSFAPGPHPHPAHAAGHRAGGHFRSARRGAAHRQERLPCRRRDRARTDQGVRQGALPHRPRLSAKNPARTAGKRHRRLAARSHRARQLCKYKRGRMNHEDPTL